MGLPGPLERTVGSARYRDAMSIATLELDLEVFSGPFDLLLTLVLREEVDLMELQIADVVLAYLDHLEARGELDLESATEFIVLIAALLELKSRLLIAGDDAEELLDIEPEQAAEELLARMLQAHRYRGAAGICGICLRPRAAFATALRRFPRICGPQCSIPPTAPRIRRRSAKRLAACCGCRRRSVWGT